MIDQRKTVAQQNKQPVKKAPQRSSFDPSRLEFGGSLGLQFGDYTTVNISPEIGYRFTNYLSAGIGIGYTYASEDRYNLEIKEHYGSFNVYGTLYPTSFLIFSVRPEMSRVWQTVKYRDYSVSDSKFVPSVVVGGGVRLGPMVVQIKYDVVQDDYSPYGNRIFYSVGYTIGR